MSERALPLDLTAFSWEEVAAVLFAAKGIKEGLWFVGVGMSFAGTTTEWAAPEMTQFFPTGQVAINTIVIGRALNAGPMVFDAALLVGRKNLGQTIQRSESPPNGGNFMVPTAKNAAAKKAAAKKAPAKRGKLI